MFKKILFLLILPFLNGCSSDGSNEDSNSDVQLQNVPLKITETIYFGSSSDVTTTKFNYAGGKLISLEKLNEPRKTLITYNGDKPVKFSIYNNGVLVKEQNINYQGDKLLSVIDSQNLEKTEFYYTNEVLDLITHSQSSGGSWITNSTDKYFFSNSNLIKKYHTTYYPSASAIKIEYDFDTKNNPFKNLNKYLKLLLEYETIEVGNLNNSTSARYYATVSSTTPESNRNFVNTYNSNNYPTEVIKYLTESNAQLSKIEILY